MLQLNPTDIRTRKNCCKLLGTLLNDFKNLGILCYYVIIVISYQNIFNFFK